MIRLAVSEDLDRIMELFITAKAFMARIGNPNQWKEDYPSRQLLTEDIAAGTCHVEEEAGKIHGVFVCIPGEDPTYRVIENGRWRNDRPYAAVHRIASDGTLPGFTARCLDFCRTLCPELRVDTHGDNRVMQHLLEKYGFHRCGMIRGHDGQPRIAYQLAAETPHIK